MGIFSSLKNLISGSSSKSSEPEIPPEMVQPQQAQEPTPEQVQTARPAPKRTITERAAGVAAGAKSAVSGKIQEFKEERRERQEVKKVERKAYHEARKEQAGEFGKERARIEREAAIRRYEARLREEERRKPSQPSPQKKVLITQRPIFRPILPRKIIPTTNIQKPSKPQSYLNVKSISQSRLFPKIQSKPQKKNGIEWHGAVNLHGLSPQLRGNVPLKSQKSHKRQNKPRLFQLRGNYR